MSTKRRTHSANFKAKVALDAYKPDNFVQSIKVHTKLDG